MSEENGPSLGRRIIEALRVGGKKAIKWGLVIGALAIGASFLGGIGIGAGIGGVISGFFSAGLFAPVGMAIGGAVGALLGPGIAGLAGGFTTAAMYGAGFGFIWNAAEEFLTGDNAQAAYDQEMSNRVRMETRNARVAALEQSRDMQAMAAARQGQALGLNQNQLPGGRGGQRESGVFG